MSIVRTFKVCALLSTTPAEMCLTVVMMLYRAIWFECRSSMFRILLPCSSRRSVLDFLQRSLLNFLTVKLRYLVG